MKFGVVGVIAFIIDYGLLALLTEVFGVNYLVSATISFTASVIFNRDRAVRVTRKGDLRSVARKDFVACVIEHFLNDVQGVIGEGVHTRPLPDGFKPL